MGRFYKTSKGEYLDFIYQQPRNMLLQAVKTADNQIAKQEAKAADLYGRLKFNALTPDVERRDEIISGYKQEIDTLAEDIRNNPLDYRRDTPKMRALSDKIKDDIERGEISAIEANYTARQNYSAKLDEQIKSKIITPDEKSQLLNRYDTNFAGKLGTQFKGPSEFQGYSTGFLAPNVNLFEEIDKRGTGIKEFLEQKAGWNIVQRGDGKYIVTTKSGTKHVSPERVQSLIGEYLKSDPTLRDAFGTRTKEGIRGYSPKEVQGMYASGLNYALNKFAFVQKTKDVKAKEEGFAMAGYKNMLKNKKEVLFRNQDQVAWGNLFGGTRTYEESEKKYNEFNEQFNAQANSIQEGFKKDLLSKYGLQIVDGQVTDAAGAETPEQLRDWDKRIEDYEIAVLSMQAAFNRAKKTGDFDEVNLIAKQNNLELDEDAMKDFTTGYTPEEAAEIVNYENKKNAIKKKAERDFKTKNPNEYKALKDAGLLEDAIEAQVQSTLNQINNAVVSTDLFEEQQIGEGKYFDDVQLQQDYLKYLDLLASDPKDAMTGKGGKLLIQGSQGEGADPLTADFNSMVEDGAIKFSQNARVSYEEYTDPDTKETKQRKIITDLVDGKEIRFTAGRLFHTYDEITGMDSGFKYKQRFTVSYPGVKPGEGDAAQTPVLEISMVQPESKLPLPDKYARLKDPNIAYNRKAANILIRAEKANQGLTINNAADMDELEHHVSGISGLVIKNDSKGNPTHYVNGEKVSRDAAANYIKLKIQNQTLK